jgi:antitoxin (DNA-binding transcriptional repressor) of toxin-antitoxin stability system
MKAITKRELNQQTAVVLESVSVGQPVIVTERGVARWRIEAIDPASDPVARLRAEGRVMSARRSPAPWIEVPPMYTPDQVTAIHAASRDDR